MQALALEHTAIDKLARLFSSKHARGDLNDVMSSAGVKHIPPSDKYTKLRVAFLDLYEAREIGRLGTVIDAITNIHVLETGEIEEVERHKMLLGIGRVVSVDLGAYGSLSVDQDTKRMIRAYATLRALENKLREFIDFKLRLSFGEKWWQSNTSVTVRESADRARAKELASTWQSIMIDSDIYYTDFKHLKSIVAMGANWQVFVRDFVDQGIIDKLGELEVVRNIIAHSRTLSETELNRLELYTHDALKAIGAIKD